MFDASKTIEVQNMDANQVVVTTKQCLLGGNVTPVLIGNCQVFSLPLFFSFLKIHVVPLKGTKNINCGVFE